MEIEAMGKSTKRWLFVAAAALVITALLAVLQGPRGEDRCISGGHHTGFFGEELEHTDDHTHC